MTWRERWAADLTPEQRSNLRSWGVDCPEPPTPAAPVPVRNDPIEIGRHLEAIARGDAVVVCGPGEDVRRFRSQERARYALDKLYGAAAVRPEPDLDDLISGRNA